MKNTLALVFCLLLVISGPVSAIAAQSQQQQYQQENRIVSEPVQQSQQENQRDQAEPADQRNEMERQSTTDQDEAGLNEGEQDTEALPRTASPLALLALIGLGSVGGAAFLRKLNH